MLNTSPDLSQKSLLIKQEDKFFSKLLQREGPVSNPSFRVYYGDLSGSVPFLWETTPGTPKHPSHETSVPPLTPPPSYYFKPSPRPKPNKRNPRSGLLQILFPKSTPKHPVNLSSESSLSSSSSSSSSSLWSWSMSPNRNPGKSRLSTPGSSFDSRAEDAEEAMGSPTSTLCFVIGRGASGKLRGCY